MVYHDSSYEGSKPRLREVTAGTVIPEQLVKSQADPSAGGLHLLIVFYGRL
jgi:hypothetical protein